MSLARWFNQIFDGCAFEGEASAYVRPKPQIAVVRDAPSREDFAAWRDHPVTQFVMAGLRRNAGEHRDLWASESWNTGHADQAQLTVLRERADAMMGLVEADYEAWCETLGLEPVG